MQCRDVGDDDGVVGRFAHGADDFIVVAVADEEDGVAFACEPHRLQVHFGDQRACGVDHFQVARDGIGPDGGRNSVRAEDDARPFGYLGQLFDENGAAIAEFLR